MNRRSFLKRSLAAPLAVVGVGVTAAKLDHTFDGTGEFYDFYRVLGEKEWLSNGDPWSPPHNSSMLEVRNSFNRTMNQKWGTPEQFFEGCPPSVD